MSETSTPYTSASTSTSVAENETVSLADKIKKYDMVKLIEYLQGQKNLKLSKIAIKILEKKELNGGDLFDLTEKRLCSVGLGLEPAMRLVKFAKECKDKKLRLFFSYKTVKIDNEDEELEQCITEIKQRIGIIGSATGRNEAVHCEYISPILYASIYIVKRITKKGITMDFQFEVVGEEASGQVDYAIKKVIDVINEELIAITEGKQKDLVAGFMQNIMQLKSSHHTNTRKRKASVAFDDEFDYLYGNVTTGRAFQSLV